MVKFQDETGQLIERQDVMVWHTHPSGHIGPSGQDLKTKVPDMHYLVVALPHGEATVF